MKNIKAYRQKLRILFVLIYLVSFATIYYLITSDKDKKVQTILNSEHTILNNSMELSKIAFSSLAVHVDGIVQKNTYIQQLLKEANNAHSEQRNQLREALFDILHDEFNELYGAGVVELQIVLANKKSFLRMHAPQFYDDNILDDRHIISHVFKTKKKISSFELSEYEHAFRYAYPILDDKDTFLGVLEIGFSSLKLSQYISKVYNQNSYFLLHKDEVKRHDSQNLYQKWYEDSLENSNYVIFKYFKNSNSTYLSLFTPKNKKTILKKMQLKQPFTIYKSINENMQLGSFYPIKDFSGHHAAYLVSYSKNKQLWDTFNMYHILVLLNLVGLAFLFYFIYKIIFYNRQLKLEVAYKEEQEKRIHQAQEDIKQYQQLFIQSKAIKLIVDPKTKRITDANEAALKFYGYSYDEITSMKISDINTLDEEEIRQKINEAVNEKRDYFVFKHRISSGEIRDVEVHSGPITLDGEQRLYSIVHDITVAKKQEQEIRDIKNRLQLAIDGSKDGLWDWDLKTDSVFFSNQWKEMFGFEEDDNITSISEMRIRIHPEDREKTFSKLDSYLKGEVKVFENEHRMQHKNGTYSWVLSRAKALFDKEGNPYRMVGFHKDISQQKEYENNLKAIVDFQVKQLRKKDEILQEQVKLASMGEMIGAIAHQWRQPLNALYINIYMLEDDFEDGLIDKKFIEEFIQKNREIVMFMSRTIDDFRNFYRIDKVKKEFSVLESINTTINLQSAQLKSNNIEIKTQGEDFTIKGYQTEFQQVILNLINNAKDAILEHKIENGKIRIILYEHQVIVENSGKTIREDIINRIFEPYFTTKEEGKGTGMGLYISKKIIDDNLGGKLSVKNVSDAVQFTIDLKGVVTNG